MIHCTMYIHVHCTHKLHYKLYHSVKRANLRLTLQSLRTVLVGGHVAGLFFFRCIVMVLLPVAGSHSPFVPLRYLHRWSLFMWFVASTGAAAATGAAFPAASTTATATKINGQCWQFCKRFTKGVNFLYLY